MGGSRRARVSRAVAVAGACAVAAILLPGGGPASASTKGVPHALLGCWHRRAPALPAGTPAGVWLIKISRAGQLFALRPGTTGCSADPDFTAAISVSGSHLVIGPVPGWSAATGVYLWKATANSLTLHAKTDPSVARKLLFSGVWKTTPRKTNPARSGGPASGRRFTVPHPAPR
jgi:hypothetical protein